MRNKFFLAVASSLVLVFFSACSSTPEVAEAPPAQEAAPEPVAVQEPAQAPAQVKPESEIALETTFYFDFDQATLPPGDRPTLELHAERLKETSQVIRIEGHADERGTEAYNQALAQRRADAVRNLLISMGVNSSQIQTVSFGEKNPAVIGIGEAAWQKNRRVEIKTI